LATLASLLVRLAVDRTAFTTNMRAGKAEAEDFAVGVTKSMNTAAASAEAAWARIAAAQSKAKGTQASFGTIKVLKMDTVTQGAQEANAALAGTTAAVNGMSNATAGLNTHLQMTKYLMASFLVLGLVNFFAGAAKGAADFQSEMLLLHTQARATTAEVEKMTTAVMGLAAETRTGPEELAKGLYHIESVGISGARALDVLTVAAKGARLGNADLEDTTNALVAAVTSGIDGVQSMTAAMGTLDAIVGTGNMRMEDLVTSLRSGLLSTAKQFGLNIQEVGAALAAMTDQGIPATEAATRMRIAFSLLAAPTRQAALQMSRIGLASTDIATAMRGPDGLIGALRLLKDHLENTGLTVEEQSQLLVRAFGGGRTSSGILTMINSLDLMEKKLGVINSTSGKFNELVEAQQKTSTAAFQKLGATIEVLSIQLGNVLLPVLSVVADVLSALASQTYILIPSLIFLGGVITAIATKAMVSLISSGLNIIKEFGLWIITNTGLGTSLMGLATAENVATVSTAGLTAAAGTLLAVLGPLAIAIAAVGAVYMKVSSDLDKENAGILKQIQDFGTKTTTTVEELQNAKKAAEAALAQSKKNIVEGGATFGGFWDIFGTQQKVQAQIDLLDALIAEKQKQSGADAASGFADGFNNEFDQFMDKTQSLIDQFGTSFDAIDAAAKVAGGDAMLEMAKGIKDLQDAPVNALKDLIAGMKDQMSAQDEIARDWGILTGRKLAEGLGAATDSYVYAQAIALKKVLEDRLAELTDGAYQAGMAFGASYVDGQIKAMEAAGDTPSELRGMREQLNAVAANNPWDKWKPSLTAVNEQMDKLNKELAETKDTSKAISDLGSAFSQIQRAAEQYFNKVHQATLQAIDDQLKHKNAILDAKAALNQAPVTAAQKALDAQRAHIEEFRLREAIAKATDPEAYRDAVLALQDFLAQQHINEMQSQVDAAGKRIDAQKAANERIAQQQKDAENARYEQMQRDFERQLELLQRYLSKHPGAWQDVQDKIIKLLHGYGFSYKNAGTLLGKSFTDGFKEQLKAAEQAVKDLAAATAANANPGPDTTGGFAAGSASLRAAERALHKDLNGNGIIGLKSGMWSVLNDNLLAFLHQDEMVAPAETADILRQIGSKPRKGSRASGFEQAMETAEGRGGGTIILQIGEEKLAELMDQGLTVHESAYVTRRPTLNSRR
jgi:TP901 family phage tail tape measure protein